MNFCRIFLIAIALIVGAAWATPTKPARIVYAQLSRIGSLDPYMISGIDSFTVTGWVIEPLTRIDPYTQNLEPCLAIEWKVDEAAKSIRVKLRSNVKFHNGQLLTAEDVRFSWASFFNSEYKGEVWQGMWDQVENVIVESPSVAVLKFKQLGYQQFKNVMTSLRILPHEYYSKVNHSEWDRILIGTGPYKVGRFEANRNLELEPYLDWWGGVASNPLLVKTVTDAKVAAQLVAKGDVDLFELPSSEPLPEGVSAREAQTPFGRGIGFSLNLKSPWLGDVRMRKALLYLWNRAVLNDKVFSGKMNLALDSYSPATYYYPTRKATPYEPAQAKKWLAQLGFKDSDQDSFLDKEGRKLSLKAIVNHASDERWVGLFQSDAAQLGVHVRIEKVEDEAQWYKVLKQGKYDLAAFDGPFSEAPHASVMHSKGAYNTSGFANPKIDRFLDRLENEFSPQKRRRAYRQLITAIRDSVPELPGLYTNKVYYLASPDVTFDFKFPARAWAWRKKDQR